MSITMENAKYTKNTVAIFDLFQVLVSFDPLIVYRKIIRDEARLEAFAKAAFTPHFDKLKDTLPTLKEAIEEEKKHIPEFAAELDVYPINEYEMVIGEIKGTIDIVKELKAKGLRLYLLSNINKESAIWAREKFLFLDLFDGVVFSGEVGFSKPDVAIFNYLLKKYNINPKEAIFIDDNEANVKAAKGIGLDSIRFTEPEALYVELEKFDIL